MPTAAAKQKPQGRHLPAFDEIEIVYTTKDIWTNEGGDPHLKYVQYITGEINGVSYPEDGPDEERVRLGEMKLARINLFEIGGADAWTLEEILDARSDEWINSYGPLVADGGPIHNEDFEGFLQHLVIFDSVVLRPEARGFGIGRLALARAIRTWAPAIDFVTLIAGPLSDEEPERREDNDPQARKQRLAAGRRLAKYWATLGFETFPGDRSRLPVMYLFSDYRTVRDSLQMYSRWTPSTELED